MKKIKLLACAVIAAAMLYGCGISDYYYDAAGTFTVQVQPTVNLSNMFSAPTSYKAERILRDAGMLNENNTNDTAQIVTNNRAMLELNCNIAGGGSIKFTLALNNEPPLYIKDSYIETALHDAMGQFIKEYRFNSSNPLRSQSARGIVIKIGYDD